MPKEMGSPALEDLRTPNEIVVDEGTARRLEELCSTMTDTCGLVEATLQLAVEDQSEKRTTYIRAALSLSASGTRAIKMFLSEWSVLVEESKSREKSGRSARDSVGESDLARILNYLAATGPAGH